MNAQGTSNDVCGLPSGDEQPSPETGTRQVLGRDDGKGRQSHPGSDSASAEEPNWPVPEYIHWKALDAAIGPKQRALVQELLAGNTPISYRNFGHMTITEYGLTKLPGSSFAPLRKRLRAAGFWVRIGGEGRRTMHLEYEMDR